MTALAFDLPPDPTDSPATRGLRHFTPESQRRALLRILAAVDRGEDRMVAAYLAALRRCANGRPVFDRTNSTTYTWEEWQAEFGGGVSASDESGGRAQ